MLKSKICFIINPVSGARSKKHFEKEIYKGLDKTRFDIDIKYSEHVNHATALAAEAVKQNIDIVVAVGGDGTVNEVAGALIHQDTRLGVIPYGSGNGFAMHLGLGRDPVQALNILNTGVEKIVDACSLNDKYYVNLAGVGFDAKVALGVKESKRRGFQAYFRNSVKEAIKYKNQSYTIQYDDEDTVTGKYLSITVANASMFGYNFTIAPNADMSDGVLDVIHIKDANKLRYFSNLHRFLNRTIDKSALTQIRFAKKVVIQSDEQMYYHIDGEGIVSYDKLTFQIVPKALKVIVPDVQ